MLAVALGLALWSVPAEAGWRRTELYFGTSIPDGGEVDEAAFADFVHTEVESRFPDGFTLVDAVGEWKGGSEATHVLVVLWRRDRAADEALDAIRAAYVARFQQESVLRVDQRASVGF